MTRFFRKITFTIFAVFLVPGCKQERQRNYKEKKEFVDQEEFVYELEARLYDIPIPFHSKSGILLSDREHIDESIILKYTVIMPSKECLLSFYEKEMEVLGWQQMASASGSESLLLFEKPQRWVALSVKKGDTHEKQELIIFSGKKFEYTVH